MNKSGGSHHSFMVFLYIVSGVLFAISLLVFYSNEIVQTPVFGVTFPEWLFYPGLVAIIFTVFMSVLKQNDP